MVTSVLISTPLKPSDLTVQSLPFAYLAVQFSLNDNQQHQVQLYSDTSGGEYTPISASDNSMSILIECPQQNGSVVGTLVKT